MISIDDALALAGQVLTDYDTATAQGLPDTGSGQAGRLAHALRDLTVAAVAFYGTPVPARPVGALTGVVTQCEQAAARLEAEAVRLAARAARRPGRMARLRDGLARLVWAWASRAARRVGPAETLAVPAGEVAVLRQALADGLIWRSVRGQFAGAECGGQICDGCRQLGTVGCPFTGAGDGLRDRYRGLLVRLGPPPQQGAGS